MVAQQGASTAHDAGITGHGVLTMEEKLQRWKQAKSDQQKSVHHRRNSVAVIKHDTVGNISRSGVVKRKVAVHSRTTTSRSPDMSRSRFPAPKKSRYSEVIRHTAPRSSPVATKLAAIKRVAAPKSALKALGSVLLPILIEDTSEPSPVESEKPAPSQQDRGANTALEKKNHAEPSQKLPAPVTAVKKIPELFPKGLISPPGMLRSAPKNAQMPKEKIKKVLTPRNKDLPKQILKPVPAPLNLNAGDLPIATTQPLSDPRPTAKSPRGWNALPALDKENQAEVLGLRIQILPAPVITVEKKPGLLAKDLIKVAIGFENRHRMATALSIFKRAYHVLPTKSTKLVERLMHIEREHPDAADQVPSQETSTTAYMVKVLERDLMAVLDHGTTKELTELYAIGAKRAEFVLEQRPYRQLEGLQRVPGISANVIARLYEHHTNWESHL